MAEGAQGRVAVARIEQGGRDPAEVARPDEVIDVVAVVVGLAPGRGRRGHEGACVRLVLEAVEDGEGRSREHAVVAADLAERPRDLDLGAPGTLEGLADRAGAFLQGGAGDLFGVGPRVREADGELKRARADADLRADASVAGSRAVVLVGELAVGVAEVDVDVRGAEVPGGGAAERPDDADPYVLLLHQQRGRMGVDDAAEVALGEGLPVRGGLHVEAQVGQLGGERRRDQQRILFGVGEELLGQTVFVVRRLDAKGRNARREPADRVIAVGGIVDRRRSAGRGEEAQLVQRDAVEKGKEDLAERALRERVPDLAPGTGRRAEGHLASRPPHRGRAWSARSFHRVLSMESAWAG